MLSRVANSIYWMTRYLERTENVARFIEVNINMMLDMKVQENQQWEPLVITTGDDELFYSKYDKADQDNVIDFLTFDRSNPNSIISSLRMARENARSIKEVISSEMWEQINKFYNRVKEAESRGIPSDYIDEFYSMVKRENHLFIGITDSTMHHDEGWHFAKLGRHLERADKTSRILDVKYFILLDKPEDVGTPIDNIQWAALLTSASALEMYRKKFRQIAPDRIAEFLILDRRFPRAVRYCITEAEDALHSITGSVPGTYNNEADRKMGKLRSHLDYANIDEIINSGLHEYLDNFQLQLYEVGTAINDTFFNI